MRRAGGCCVLAVVLLGCGAALGAENPLERRIKELEAEVARLRGRVADLEAELAKRKAEASVTLRIGEPEDPEAADQLDQPLDEKAQAAVEAATERVARLAGDIGKHSRTSAAAEYKAAVERWAAASGARAVLLARHGQERMCAGALAKFRSGKDRTEAAQRTFETAAYTVAATFLDRWKKPDSAMRLAAAHGPKSISRAEAWGALCERTAAISGNRSHKALALRCYLRAVVVSNSASAKERVRALEAELKSSP